jgi:hypothetical protein
MSDIGHLHARCSGRHYEARVMRHSQRAYFGFGLGVRTKQICGARGILFLEFKSKMTKLGGQSLAFERMMIVVRIVVSSSVEAAEAAASASARRHREAKINR